jgi:hypothetical protein
MEVYKDSMIDKDEFDFQNILPYFKDPVAYTASKYEALMDDLSDKIQYLPEDKRKKYTKFMLNIIAHFSVLSKLIGREIEDINIPIEDLNSDIKINYIKG